MGARWNDGRRFEGRVAVVTGAGGTLGGAVARGFGSEGASVALGYRCHAPGGEVVAELESLGGQAHAGQLDITDQQSVNAFVADVAQRYGRLDVLVNAAGRLDEADTVRFSELDTEAASALFEVDVIGATRMCHAVRPIMLQGGGAYRQLLEHLRERDKPRERDQFRAGHLLRREGRNPRFHRYAGPGPGTRNPCRRARPWPDLRGMGDGVGNLARAHRGGDRDEPAQTFR